MCIALISPHRLTGRKTPTYLLGYVGGIFNRFSGAKVSVIIKRSQSHVNVNVSIDLL